MNNQPYPNEEESMELFYSEEIRNVSSIAEFFLNWLQNGNDQPTSGNAFFLEKKGEEIVIGNLFDENIPETTLSKQDMIDFINSKLNDL